MNNSAKEQFEMVSQQLKELEGIYRGAISRFRISENEFWVWYTLVALDGEYSQQDICTLWSLPKQTINTIIMRMTQKGLVFLEMAPGARNRKIIRPTQQGKIYGDAIVLPISKAEQRTFDRLPAETQNACTIALGKYINILKEEIRKSETE